MSILDEFKNLAEERDMLSALIGYLNQKLEDTKERLDTVSQELEKDMPVQCDGLDLVETEAEEDEVPPDAFAEDHYPFTELSAA